MSRGASTGRIGPRRYPRDRGRFDDDTFEMFLDAVGGHPRARLRSSSSPSSRSPPTVRPLSAPPRRAHATNHRLPRMHGRQCAQLEVGARNPGSVGIHRAWSRSDQAGGVLSATDPEPRVTDPPAGRQRRLLRSGHPQGRGMHAVRSENDHAPQCAEKDCPPRGHCAAIRDRRPEKPASAPHYKWRRPFRPPIPNASARSAASEGTLDGFALTIPNLGDARPQRRRRVRRQAPVVHAIRRAADGRSSAAP